MKKNVVRCLLLLLTAMWMIIIFSFSAQSGEASSGVSALITEPVTRLIVRIVGGMSENQEEALYLHVDEGVRMAAHFLEYTILGLLLTGVLRAYDVKAAWLAWMIGLLYAATDEWHQAYSPGRTSDPMDVLIDAAGVL